MSSDIYAKPDFSKKVRYNRKVEEEGAQQEEKEVEIYAECVQDIYTNFPSQEEGPPTQNHALGQQWLFRAALGVAVLTLLLMAGITILSIYYASANISQLQDEVKTLSETIQAANISQLQNEFKSLRKTIQGKGCPVGWTRFGCSCYVKFTGSKTWDESRRDCQSRGADLVIINNQEEQKYQQNNNGCSYKQLKFRVDEDDSVIREFIRKLNNNVQPSLQDKGESWIGLTSIQKQHHPWPWEWVWVDGSPLTKTFLPTGQENKAGYGSRYACCDAQGKWIKTYNTHSKNWICEK